MDDLIALVVAKMPQIQQVLIWIGVCRVVNKPLFSFLHALVDAIPGTWDDQILSSLEGSKIYITICYILDWSLSIKLPQATKPESKT